MEEKLFNLIEYMYNSKKGKKLIYKLKISKNHIIYRINLTLFSFEIERHTIIEWCKNTKRAKVDYHYQFKIFDDFGPTVSECYDIMQNINLKRKPGIEKV